MQYFNFLLFAVLAGLGLVTAQSTGNNPFTMTEADLASVTAGEPFNITWTPTSGTTVSLVLRQGVATVLSTVETIASGIDNSGFYVWTPSTSIVAASDYALEIIDEQDTSLTDYSKEFAIASSTTSSSSLSSSVSAAASTSSITTSSSNSTTTTTGSSSTKSKTTTTTSSGITSATTTAPATTSTISAITNGAMEMKASALLMVVLGAVMAVL